MDKLTLGAQIKQQYPGSYDDLPDDQLGELAVQKYARDAQASPEDEFETPGKVWEWLMDPIAPELSREKFMPSEESGPSGKLKEFMGEVAYQFYRGVVRPSTSPAGVAMGAGLAAPGLIRKATLGAMGIMGLTGTAEGLRQLTNAESHGDRINAAVDTALSGLMGVGGLAGAASLPRNIIEAPITKIPRVFRNWRQWARATPEQQAALGGESKAIPQWRQLELPISPPEFDPVWYSQIEPKAPVQPARSLSNPWYTFKSLKALGNSLFKPDKKGRIPPAVPAAVFAEALNKPEVIPTGDAFWLGLRDLGERKMRTGDKVSWQDIVGTVEENLTLSQIYRMKKEPASAISALASQYAQEHPDVLRLQQQTELARLRYHAESRYVENFSDFLRDKMSREVDKLFRAGPSRTPAIRKFFLDQYGYESTPRGVVTRLVELLYENPDEFYGATQLTDVDAASRASSWSTRNQAKIRKQLDVIDEAAPGIGGLIRLYMDMADRTFRIYNSVDALEGEHSALVSRLTGEYRAKGAPEVPDGVVSGASPIYPNYSSFRDGADYETNVVVAKRQSFDLLDEKMQEVAERINWIDDTLRDVAERDSYMDPTGARPSVAEIEQPRAWLRAERERLDDQYNHLYEAKQFVEYDSGHIREAGSLGHYRWSGRVTQDAKGGNEGWTAFVQELQSDWNEVIRKHGMKGSFKSREFEKIWNVMQKVKGLVDQNHVLKNGSFGKYMNEIDATEPVFPQFRNLPAQSEFTEAMREPFQGQKLLIDGEPVSLHSLTPEQRNTLIRKNEAEINKLHESVRREMKRYYGGDLRFVREPIYDYDRYNSATGNYPIIGYNEGWVTSDYAASYSESVGPFVDDANKINELLAKAFIRRALTKGLGDGKQYEYIGLIGGKMSAMTQSYGMPTRHVEIAPSGEANLSSTPGQQPLLGTYNVRTYDKSNNYSGTVYHNQTIKDISDMFGEEFANRIASESWGNMTGGEPLMEPVGHGDRSMITYYRSHAQRSRKTKKAQDRMFQELLKSNGYLEKDEQFFKVADTAWDLLPQRTDRGQIYAQIDNWIPRRFELSEVVVLPTGPNTLGTYKGQVNAYDGMNRGIMSKIAKEYGSELEEGRTWVVGRYGTNPTPEDYYYGDWHKIWRMKVTPKMLETVLYGLTGISP